MRGASDAAHAMANGIKDIPDHKNVTVGIGWDIAAVPIASVSAAMRKTLTGHAVGGLIGGVGTRDTELGMLTPGEFIVRRDGSNITDALKHFGAKTVTPAAGSGSGADVVGAIQALGDRFGAELQRQARTIRTMQRQMA